MAQEFLKEFDICEKSCWGKQCFHRISNLEQDGEEKNLSKEIDFWKETNIKSSERDEVLLCNVEIIKDKLKVKRLTFTDFGTCQITSAYSLGEERVQKFPEISNTHIELRWLTINIY